MSDIPRWSENPSYRHDHVEFGPGWEEKLFGAVAAFSTKDGSSVTIRAKNNVQLDHELLGRLQESGFRALRIIQKISGFTGRNLMVFCGEDFDGYMRINGDVSRRMFEDDPNSQIGAILHELIEDFQEDKGVYLGNVEGLPDLIEFLFTGNSRVGRFRRINADFFSGNTESSYSESWGDIVQALLPNLEEKDPDRIFNLLLEKRELSEDEKGAIVNGVIERLFNEKKSES